MPESVELHWTQKKGTMPRTPKRTKIAAALAGTALPINPQHRESCNCNWKQATQQEAPIFKPTVLLKAKEAQRRMGIGNTTFYGRMSPKSLQYDPNFPPRVFLTPEDAEERPIGDFQPRRRKSAVRWRESEVEIYIEKLCTQR